MESKWMAAVLLGALLLPCAGRAFGQVTPDELKRTVAAEMKASRDGRRFPVSDKVMAEYQATFDEYIDKSPYLSTARQQEYFLSSVHIRFKRALWPVAAMDDSRPQDIVDKYYAGARYGLIRDLNQFGVAGIASAEDRSQMEMQIAQVAGAYREAIGRISPDETPEYVERSARQIVDRLRDVADYGFWDHVWTKPLAEDKLAAVIEAIAPAIEADARQPVSGGEGLSPRHSVLTITQEFSEVAWSTVPAESAPVLVIDRAAELEARRRQADAPSEYWSWLGVRVSAGIQAEAGKEAIGAALVETALEEEQAEKTVSTDAGVELITSTGESAAPATAPGEDSARGWQRNAILAIIVIVGVGFAVVRMRMARRRKG
jgi:hypothetical protein